MTNLEMTGYAEVFSRALVGLEAPEVRVEVDISNGLPACHLVGLPEAEVRESRERVRSAIQHSGFEFPNRRITINLAPADLPKNSGRFDLPIAVGVLVASGQIASEQAAVLLKSHEFVGELSLSGIIQPILGGMALALAHERSARQNSSAILSLSATSSISAESRTLLLPAGHGAEVRALQAQIKRSGPYSPKIALLRNLTEVAAWLNAQLALEAIQNIDQQQLLHLPPTATETALDLADVKGQTMAKRALEVAAAGQHSMMLIGSPGVGKSMLAQRLPGLLPEPDPQESLDRAAMLSLRGMLPTHALGDVFLRPAFRSPHHSASVAAIVGGGNPPKPGEISLAHGGVLFLDELAEFRRGALEALREPLEAHKVLISRSTRQSEFPARFQLIAAMNPCPCGYLGHYSNRCRCTPERISSYQMRVSGPLLDRIDLHIHVPTVSEAELLNNTKERNESSHDVAIRVAHARVRQLARQGKSNAMLTPAQVNEHCDLSVEVSHFLQQVIAKLGWSGRSIHRVLKVARTIADLQGVNDIDKSHVAEAVQWRRALNGAS